MSCVTLFAHVNKLALTGFQVCLVEVNFLRCRSKVAAEGPAQ